MTLASDVSALVDLVSRNLGRIEAQFWETVLHRCLADAPKAAPTGSLDPSEFGDLVRSGAPVLRSDELSQFGSGDDPASPSGFFRTQVPKFCCEDPEQIVLYAPCVTSALDRIATCPEFAAAFPWEAGRSKAVVGETLAAATKRARLMSDGEASRLRELVRRIKFRITFAPIETAQTFYEEGMRFHAGARSTRTIASTSPGILLPHEWYGDLYSPGITTVLEPGWTQTGNQTQRRERTLAWRHLMRERLFSGRAPKLGLLRMAYFEEAVFGSGLTRPLQYFTTDDVGLLTRGRQEEARADGTDELFLSDQSAIARATVFRPGVSVSVLSAADWTLGERLLRAVAVADEDRLLLSLRGDDRRIARGFLLRPSAIGSAGAIGTNIAAATWISSILNPIAGAAGSVAITSGWKSALRTADRQLRGRFRNAVSEAKALSAVVRDQTGRSRLSHDAADEWIRAGTPF